jgi:outer membrane protein OmpA-like peptidoglycan-associated protein
LRTGLIQGAAERYAARLAPLARILEELMRKLLLASALVFAAPLSALAADSTVFFALGSAALTAESRATISQAASDFAAGGSPSVSIVGHTDTTGSAEYNMRLSQRRAEAVGQALIDAGVPAGAIVAAWRGQDDLAVPTADNVAEPRNRRVELSIAAADGAPAAEAAPVVEEALRRLRIGLGPYVGFSFEEDDESVYLGGNLIVSYFVTPNIALSAEQAVFYNTDAKDEGWGSRSMLGADYHFGDIGFGSPYIGANAGYLTIDGSGTGGFTYGPEIGLTFGAVEAKLAYDFVEDRDAEEGVISLTLGYNFLSF